MRILLVEDEPALAAQLTEGIRSAGYVVDVAGNGLDGHFMGNTEPYDAVVLDIGLPQMDGITVLRKWRAAGRSMPVLILTARDTWHEKVAGIDAGADDYLAKPFHMEELLARLRALIRRAGGHASTELVCGPLTLDTRSSRVSVDGAALTLTSHEYRVLAYLMHHQGEIVSRGDLTEHIYAQDFDRDSNTVEVFIARLRKKLPPGLIETVRGLGYRLNHRPSDRPSDRPGSAQ
jgi:two-component system OmpR family response regulator